MSSWSTVALSPSDHIIGWQQSTLPFIRSIPQAEVPHARLSVRLGHTAPPCHEASTLVLDRC